MKIVTVVGARPQFIKAGVVSRAIRQLNEKAEARIAEVLVHTGQHYDEKMSDVFFSQLSLPRPAYNLDINRKSHGAMTGAMLEAIELVLLKECPDAVLVYGDTNSTLAGALAAVKMQIAVAHVEAGLRSRNMIMPEESNRILTDRISSWLFCPTDDAVSNLESEGARSWAGVRYLGNVGDVMLDACEFYVARGREDAECRKTIEELELPPKFVLATVHREENTADVGRLRSILGALQTLARDTRVVFPIHPRTLERVRNLEIDLGAVQVTPPLGYMEMLQLIDRAALVLTDSGGLQKEAYFRRKRCLTLRDETEWVELTRSGANRLVGADREAILAETAEALRQPLEIEVNAFYGSGHAAENLLGEMLRT